MDNPKFPGALTVTQLNEYIKGIIDHDIRLSDVYLKGEISNFKNHYSTGHFYFTLKDEGSMIRAIMFRSSASKLPFLPEDGMKVIAHGRIAAFVRDGQYQIYCVAWSRTASEHCISPMSSSNESLRRKDCSIRRTKSRCPKYPRA